MTYLAQSPVRRGSFGVFPLWWGRLSRSECENKRPESVEAATVKSYVVQLLVIPRQDNLLSCQIEYKTYQRSSYGARNRRAWALSWRFGKHSITNIEHRSNSGFFQLGRRRVGQTADGGMCVHETVNRGHVGVRI